MALDQSVSQNLILYHTLSKRRQ